MRELDERRRQERAQSTSKRTFWEPMEDDVIMDTWDQVGNGWVKIAKELERKKEKKEKRGGRRWFTKANKQETAVITLRRK